MRTSCPPGGPPTFPPFPLPLPPRRPAAVAASPPAAHSRFLNTASSTESCASCWIAQCWSWGSSLAGMAVPGGEEWLPHPLQCRRDHCAHHIRLQGGQTHSYPSARVTCRFTKSVIESRAALTYAEAQGRIDDTPPARRGPPPAPAPTLTPAPPPPPPVAPSVCRAAGRNPYIPGANRWAGVAGAGVGGAAHAEPPDQASAAGAAGRRAPSAWPPRRSASR